METTSQHYIMSLETHQSKRCRHSLDSSEVSNTSDFNDFSDSGTEITGDKNLEAEVTGSFLTRSNTIEASTSSEIQIGAGKNNNSLYQQKNDTDEGSNVENTISKIDGMKHLRASIFTKEKKACEKERFHVASKKNQVTLISLWHKKTKTPVIDGESAKAGEMLPEYDVSEHSMCESSLDICDFSNSSSHDSLEDDYCEQEILSSDLPTMWKDSASLKCPHSSSSHTFLISNDSQFRNLEMPPHPFPETLNIEDIRWDDDHVRLPYAPQNKFVDAGKCVSERWSIITQCLKDKEWSCSLDIEQAITRYNKYNWDFTGFHEYCDKMSDAERAQFFGQVLPRITRLVLSLPSLCTQPLPLLKIQHDSSITMSQEQVACLLANAFFCTFPARNISGGRSGSPQLPTINFNSLFRKTSARYRSSQHAKFDCLLNYFRRVTTKMPPGAITYRRQILLEKPDWASSNHKLTDLCVTSAGTIEDCANGMLHVDFANKVIGGGVLSEGCVQEEIRFMICPEMIVSRLFTEQLADNECLVITGAERFSNYTGYGHTFCWHSNHNDVAPRDSCGRLVNEIVAIDAMVFSSLTPQLSERNMCRELNKAFCGFFVNDEANVCTVATGNWGCGAFGGDHRIKALVQLMAAAEAGRPVYYFTFGDTALCRDIHRVHSAARLADFTVGRLWDFIRAGGQSSADIYRRIINACHSESVLNDSA